MELRLTVVDTFTAVLFGGNPAAVTLLEAFFDDALLGNIAREMHLSETAFLVPRADGGHDLRWFTPAAEVDLCRHVTPATAARLPCARFIAGVSTCWSSWRTPPGCAPSCPTSPRWLLWGDGPSSS